MTLQARLTLWSMLVMALIVTLVSISDMIGEINRQFEYSLDSGNVILSYTPSLINGETAKSLEPNLADAIAKSDSLKKKIFDLAVAWKAVDEIAVTDPDGHVLVSSYQHPAGQIFVTHPDFKQLVEHDHWWVKWRVLFWTDDTYELSEALRDSQTGSGGSCYVSAGVHPCDRRTDLARPRMGGYLLRRFLRAGGVRLFDYRLSAIRTTG